MSSLFAAINSLPRDDLAAIRSGAVAAATSTSSADVDDTFGTSFGGSSGRSREPRATTHSM